MECYKEYIKGGEILIAPSSDFKDIFLIKCNVCDEYYSQFETFFSHHFTHYEHDENGKQPPPSEALQELFGDMLDNLEVPEAANDGITSMYDDLVEDEEEVAVLNKGEYNSESANEFVKHENRLLELKSNSNDTEAVIHETIEIKRLHEGGEDANWENDDSVNGDNDESTNPEEHKSNDFIHNFMKSKETVISLIALYKSQPKLWDNNMSPHLKPKTERLKCLQQITAELEETKSIKITQKQLEQVIVHLRRNYKKKLEKDKTAADEQKQEVQQQSPWWFCQYLGFLKPFLEQNPLAVLDNVSQDLNSEQIVQILNIYERCPCLWNTSLMENYCYNKHSEGIQQMLSLIQLEMNLQVNENTVQKYVHCVNINFSREKRRYMGIVMSEEGQTEYFEHMMFLYDHVGPFQCSVCRRNFNSLLHLKVHESEHNGRVPLKCTECHKGFKTVESYVYHIRRHMNDLNITCKECGKRFLRTSQLRSHMRYHTGVKPYCCEFCGSSFGHSQVLNIHRKRHEKKFMFFCPICAKGFYTKTHMEIHNKIHNDEREFVCATCGKAFKTRKNLQQHEFTHEEGRKHRCTVCDKRFKNKMNLRQHFKTHLRKGSLDPKCKSKLNSIFEKD